MLTERFKLPPDKLWVTTFETDDEAHDLWREIGMPEERIKRYGEEHNYSAATSARAGRTARSTSTGGRARRASSAAPTSASRTWSRIVAGSSRCGTSSS
jgi:hypothetical protein